MLFLFTFYFFSDPQQQFTMEAKLQNFVKWMKDNGFNLNPKLELKRMPDERGHSAVAAEKIKVIIFYLFYSKIDINFPL